MADFDPTQPFETIGSSTPATFDPSQPFEEVPARAKQPERTFAGLPKGGGVEPEGMVDAMRAAKAAAKAFWNKFTEAGGPEMTGNIPLDVGSAAANIVGRGFTGAQEAVAATGESLGPKVDPLFGKLGLGTTKQLAGDIAALPESEFGSAGAGMKGAARAPTQSARVLENIARESRGKPPSGPPGVAGPPREPTFPPATGPEPPGYAPPEPLAQGRAGLDPNVRLLPPDLPVGAPVRDSVGAARAQSALEQADPAAVRILEDQARNEGWTEHTLDQLEAEQSPHAFLGESSENFESLTKGAQNLPGQARTEINQTVNQRHRELPNITNAIHDEYLGPDVDRTQWEAALREAAERESSPFWRQFDAMRPSPSAEIEAVLKRPGMKRAMAAANDTLLNRGMPVDNGFPVLGEEEAAGFGDNASRETAARQATETRVPTARAFQLAKEHIDGVINDAVRSGKTQVVRTYTQLKHDLDAAIAADPNADIARVWQQARQTYRGPMALINAREIGESLLSGETHHTAVRGILENMSPEQQAAVRLGLRNHMADVAGRPGSSSQLRNIREVLGPDNQRKIAEVLGPDRAEAYISALEQAQRMHFAPGRLTQGSDTERNRAYRELITSYVEPSLLARGVGAAGKVGRVIASPKEATIRAGVEALQAGQNTRAAQQLEGITTSLGRLLTTQGPERDAIRRELVRRLQEGEGGLAGPVGRQPLAPEVLERGRSGRPIRRSRLPIGTEGQILERAEQRLGEGPRVVGSQKEMDDILKKNWAENGRELDYDDVWQRPGPDVWAQEIEAWNKAHPEKPMPGPDERYTFGDNREFEHQFESKHLKDANGEPLRQPYPGAKEANAYFAEDQPELTAFTSHRQMRNLENETGIQLLPDKMQAMAFKDEPTRRRFLQGMASAVAATNPELGKIAAGLTKATAALPRLEDAGYGRSLARQAMYMFNDDKAAALDYLMDHVKHSRPGSVVDKANQDAVRHITGGDIDKEPGIWEKSIAEMRAHDEQIRAAQSARQAAEQLAGGAEEEPVRGRRELPGGEGQLEASRGADQEAGRAGKEEPAEPPLEGLPRKVTVPGVGKIDVGPHQPIRDLARQYMKDAGLPYNPPRDYAKVDPARARRVADEYEKMAHAPDDPEVKKAYEAMAKETMAQWQAIKGTGFKAEFIPPGSPDPYAASPRLATEDIKNNNHMWVFSTRDGFGTLEGFDPSTNPLLADSGEKFGTQPALLNDIFRVVHDYFGHAKEGVGFRADGEENAWRSHSAMYSPEARKAMTSETRGQNSWLNYGPHGDKNRSAKTEDTVFADQKTGVLPDWVVNEGSGLPEKPSLVKTGGGGPGSPFRTGKVGKYVDALVLNKITPKEFEGFMDAMGTDKALTSKMIDDAKKEREGLLKSTREQLSGMEDEGEITRRPLARDVTERGRSGRPTRTTPMATGQEADVLRSGYNLATGEHPARISQRLVTSKRAEPNPENLTVDMAAARETPAAYEHNVDLLRDSLPRKYRNAPTEKVAQAFVDHVAGNLKWLYNQVPPEIRDRSKLWYEGGRNIIDNWTKDYGIKDSSAAGVLAALSPQKDWFQNVSLAHRVLEIYHNKADVPFTPEMQKAFASRPALQKYKPMFDDLQGKSLQDIDKMDATPEEKNGLKSLFIRLYDEGHHSREHYIISPEGGAVDVARGLTGKPKDTAWKSLDEIGKAVESIESKGNPAVLDKIMGDKHKVRNFYNNLLNPNSKLGDVTIDTHAVAAGQLRPFSGASTEVNHNFATQPLDKPEGFVGARGSDITGVRGTYPFYADAYRQAAKELGILPRELQSITWEAVRGLFEAKEKKGLRNEIENIWRQHRAGSLSIGDARQQVLERAGGITPPDWHGRDGGAAEAVRSADDETKLPRSGVSGEGAGTAGRRGGGEPAGETAPLQRNVMARGRSGRPNYTEPLRTGREEDVLGAGAARAQMQRVGSAAAPTEAPANLNLTRDQRTALQDRVNDLYGRLSRLTRTRKEAGEDISQTSPMERSIGRHIDQLAKQIHGSMEASEKFHNPANPREVAEYWLDQHSGNTKQAVSWMNSILRISDAGKEKDVLRKAIEHLGGTPEGPKPEPPVDRKKSMFNLLDQLERLLGGEPEKRASGGRVGGNTRKQSNYSPTRGRPGHHCGPDKQWPDGYCSMFRGPHACTAVAGFIATKGGCDWYKRAKGQPDEDEIDGGREQAQMRRKRAGGGQIDISPPPEMFDPKPLANQSPYSLTQDFHERLDPLEGQIEDRRGRPEDQTLGIKAHALANRIEHALPDWLDIWPHPTKVYGHAKLPGKLQSEAGYEDIGREHKAFGGGFSPWQGMMRQPWWQSLMRRQGGMGSGSMPQLGRPQFQNQPQPNPPAGIAPTPPPNPPAQLGRPDFQPPPNPPVQLGQPQFQNPPPNPPALPPTMANPPPNPPARMGLQPNPPAQIQSVMSAITGDAPPMMTGDTALPAPQPNPPANPPATSGRPWFGSSLASMARGGAVEPTEAQKKAGNYRKRHISVHGLEIAIENEKGSTRSGKDKDGKPWSVTMPYHYGYIKRTEGADGDHVDVCLGPHLKSPRVFVVDQKDAGTGKFDEHKVMLGFGSAASARHYYLRGFSDGKGHRRLGGLRELTIDEFKNWLKEGDQTKPVAKAA